MTRFVLAALALSAAPALAQGHAGVFRVVGDEPGRGPYEGHVELRWDGAGYAFTREVELTAWTHQGRPVSTAWSGRARDVGAGVEVEVLLDRMGWIAEAPGLPPRTPADGVPMAVRGTFAPAAGGLAGRFVGQAPFVDPAETWTRLGAPGPAPRWRLERAARPVHRAPSSLERRALFALYASFHRTPWVAPFTGRPEFQRAVHSAVFDATDQDLLRRRPDLLRVVQRVVDPIALVEAKVKADAFGRRLATKAEGADQELPLRFTDASGALLLRVGAAPVDDNDGCLWTGVYALTQAVRHGLTNDPAALQNVERTVRGLHAHMAITGSPTEFARTLRAARGPEPRWHAGAGPFAGLEWKDGGNNDMFKGLLLGGVAAREALGGPAHAALRADYARALEALADHHPVARGNLLKAGNPLMARGVVALLTGSSSAARAYRSRARNPLHLLYVAAAGGGLMHLGQADWSGTHLELTSMIVQQRLAVHLREPLHRWAVDAGLRRSATRLAPARRSLHALVAAAYAGLPRAEAADAVQALRELPFPRAEGYAVRPTLRADFCPSPLPTLPWKRDWTTNQGRSNGLVMPPFHEQDVGNYVWKEVPYLPNRDQGASPVSHHSADYLVAYWMARLAQVVGPAD